jgi:hypothetical protein
MSVFELGVRRLEYAILACDLKYLHASAVLADNTRVSYSIGGPQGASGPIQSD